MTNDGMYNHGKPLTRRERNEEYQRAQDPYYLIEQYRREAEKVMAELTAKHDKPALREAEGIPAGAVIAMDDGRDAGHIARRVGDLNGVTHYAAKVEAAMKARQWRAAIVNAVWLGISANKAFIARPLEPEVLRDRGRQAGSVIGRAKAKKARTRNRNAHDDQDRPRYRKRMLELRENDVGYTKAADIIEDEIRQKDGAPRHNARRIRELAPDPITKQNPTPPKDYGR